ncbi:MAG: hypothetical protein RL217_1086 [Pseudomonadota bacterium]|jgi:diguanylate cyclase (GGDEF)-like protein
MTDTPLSATEKLRQHFSSRVLHQVRQVVELWQHLPELNWSEQSLRGFAQGAQKLLEFAERFEAQEHSKLSLELLQVFATLKPNQAPSSDQLDKLNSLLIELSRTSLRRKDDNDSTPFRERKPVYLALKNTVQAELMARQMHYFRLRSNVYSTPEQLHENLELRHPATLVIGVHFGGEYQGLALVQELQQHRDEPLPIIFVYQDERPSLADQLKLMRAGGIGLYPSSQIHNIIDELEKILDTTPEAPAKVLVVDDSQAQLHYNTKILNQAGILTETCAQPLEVLNKLSTFSPDLILLDMYMPQCTGVELARIIRQHKEYLNLPIIFLSGEEDKQRQLEAMAQGAEDFLTKPTQADHLVATVRNRIKRARQLQKLIACDSLTGLLNHTHILGALQNLLKRAGSTPVCFAMVDIDHFKKVNDTYGHPVGDQVIRNLSLFLRQHLRRQDPIGRYGGEEFGVVLFDANEEQAVKVLDSIRSGFANLQHDAKGLKITFSCGIAQWRGEGESLSELVARADQALYASKHNGRNRVTGASTLDAG